ARERISALVVARSSWQTGGRQGEWPTRRHVRKAGHLKFLGPISQSHVRSRRRLCRAGSALSAKRRRKWQRLPQMKEQAVQQQSYLSNCLDQPHSLVGWWLGGPPSRGASAGG